MGRAKHSKKPRTPCRRNTPEAAGWRMLRPTAGIWEILFLAALAVMVVVIYAPSLDGSFIFDDISNIEHNPHVHLTRLTPQSLWRAAFESPSAARPVSNLSFALNHYFHGLAARGYHLVNVAIHLTAGIFLYFWLKVTLGMVHPGKDDPARRWLPAATVMLWLVHPLNTQSVSYIVQRMNSLAAMFYVIALFCYARARLAQGTRSRCGLFAACGLAGLLALGSKEIAATLPVFLLLYEWIFFRDADWRWLGRRVLPVAACLAALALFFLGTQPIQAVVDSYGARDYTLTQRVLTELRVVIFYLSLLAFPNPARLNLDHDFSLSGSLVSPAGTLACAALIAGLIALACFRAGKDRLIAFGILWYLGQLAIESSVIGLEIIFEHRTYLPSMFVCLAAAALLFRLVPPPWAMIALAAVMLVFARWTYERNHVWVDNLTIWQDCIAKSPAKPRPYNNLGTVLATKGELEAAVEQFRRSVQVDPSYGSGWYNLGATLVRQGKYAEAVAPITRSLKLRPNVAEAHFSLAKALVKLGRSDEAVDHYTAALEIKPDHAAAHNNLGSLLDGRGDLAEAARHYGAALAIKPGFHEARINLGVALAKLGRLDEAGAQFRKALDARPDDAAAHFNLATALANQQNYSAAAEHFAASVRLDPEDPESRRSLLRVQRLLGAGQPSPTTTSAKSGAGR